MILYAAQLAPRHWDAVEGWFNGWPAPRLSQLAVAFLGEADARLFAVDDEQDTVVAVAAAYVTPARRMRLVVLEVHPDCPRPQLEEELRRRLTERARAHSVIDLAGPATLRTHPIRVLSHAREPLQASKPQ